MIFYKTKLGIKINNDSDSVKNFFESFNNFMNNNNNNFINQYLETFVDGSFFYTMRLLYTDIGFLHLDFKLRNIFLRKTDDNNKFILLISDLDKSRLTIPKSVNLFNNKSNKN